MRQPSFFRLFSGSVGAVEEGDHLGALALACGVEGRGSGAGGDAVLQCPEDGNLIPASGLHIGEGIFLLRRRGGALGPVQEGDHLGAVADGGGAEGGGGQTVVMPFSTAQRTASVYQLPAATSVKGFFTFLGAGDPAARHRKVTTWARLQ